MNRFLIISLFFSLFQPLLAGTTEHRMLVNGRTWNYIKLYYADVDPDTVYQSLSIDGPVEIDGKQCYKFADVLLENATTFFYEEGGKVYCCRSKTNTGEFVWKEEFDFNMESGANGVISIDDVLLNGEERRRLSFSHDVWIEGIGSLSAGIFSNWGFVPRSFMCSKVLSVYDGDECIYDANKPLLTVRQYELGTTTGLSGQTCEASRDRQHALFDLQGRRLSAVPQRGMYIRDGRKYVVK